MALDIKEMEEKHKNWSNWLKSPAGVASIKSYVQELNLKKERLIRIKEDIYDKMSDAQFKTHLLQEILKQDLSYGARETPEMVDLYTVMLDYGLDIPENDSFNMFETQRSIYKGLTISLFQGQGSFIRIYDGIQELYQS